MLYQKSNLILKKGHTIVLESTSYPGTTHDHIIKILNKNFKVGEEIFVGFFL